jgi:AraC family transcriptional regulator of adaptative response / methylphosphotriester-DNA alkyltransferase methyltransferase
MRTGTVARRRTLYEEAVEIIEREYASDLELDAVARRLATSRRQLQRAFAEAGETSFRTLLAEVRMRRALEMLREGSLPVREVAGRVGYRQAAQFAKTFRRHHGRPPRASAARVARTPRWAATSTATGRRSPTPPPRPDAVAAPPRRVAAVDSRAVRARPRFPHA